MKLTAQIEEAVHETRAVIRAGFPWWLRPWLLKEVAAITLGRRIYVTSQVREDQLESILRHELVHVRQVAEHGMVLFLWRYGVEYVQNRREGMSPDQAYRAISFERDAFAAERDVFV